MFLDNKYTKFYFKFISNIKEMNRIKTVGDGNYIHHIIPKSLGGDDSNENLVLMTLQEHRIAHGLLHKMTNGREKYLMWHAYHLMKNTDSKNPRHKYMTEESYKKMVQTRKSRGSYKSGKENNFSNPDLIGKVKQRMLENNPMKSTEQRQRMSENNNNPYCKAVEVNGLKFPSLRAASDHYNTTPYLFKKNYNYRLCDS